MGTPRLLHGRWNLNFWEDSRSYGATPTTTQFSHQRLFRRSFADHVGEVGDMRRNAQKCNTEVGAKAASAVPAVPNIFGRLPCILMDCISRSNIFSHSYRQPVDRCCNDAAAGRSRHRNLPSPKGTRLAEFPDLTKTIAFLNPEALDKFHEPQHLTHITPIPTTLFDTGSQQSLLPDDSGPGKPPPTLPTPTELIVLPLA